MNLVKGIENYIYGLKFAPLPYEHIMVATWPVRILASKALSHGYNFFRSNGA